MDDDFEEELLALAEDDGSGHKKKRSTQSSKGGSSKRSRRDDEDESEQDVDMESEDDDEDDNYFNKYPLEGKYKDEDDRDRLMNMNEMEREEILAERLEQRQKQLDKQALDAMLSNNRGGVDTVSKAAKRQHTLTGKTKEKTAKLEDLRRKRVEKSNRQSNKTPKQKTDGSFKGSDDEGDSEAEVSGSEDEDRKLTKATSEESLKIEDLAQVRLAREALAEHLHKPWFEDWVKGSYVRFGLLEPGKPIRYRICQVTGVEEFSASGDKLQPYKLENQMESRMLKMKYGSYERLQKMDMVSNSNFTADEFTRWKLTVDNDKQRLPTPSALLAKYKQNKKLRNRALTEAEVRTMLEKKGPTFSLREKKMEVGRLKSEYKLAMSRQDEEESVQLQQKITEIEQEIAINEKINRAEQKEDVMAKLNEKNKKAQWEKIRIREQAATAARLQQQAGVDGTSTALMGEEENVKLAAEPGEPTPRHLLPKLYVPKPGEKLRFWQIMAKSIELPELDDFFAA